MTGASSNVGHSTRRRAHRIDVEFLGGDCIVMVDQKLVDARVRVTYKRDGSLSTLRIGQVSEISNEDDAGVCGECDLPFSGSHDPGCPAGARGQNEGAPDGR